MGLIFQNRQNFLKFLAFAWRTPENLEKWAYISRKILRKGYLFWSKWPLEKGKGFEARAAHPRPNQSRVPPPPRDLPSISFGLFVCYHWKKIANFLDSSLIFLYFVMIFWGGGHGGGGGGAIFLKQMLNLPPPTPRSTTTVNEDILRVKSGK